MTATTKKSKEKDPRSTDAAESRMSEGSWKSAILPTLPWEDETHGGTVGVSVN